MNNKSMLHLIQKRSLTTPETFRINFPKNQILLRQQFTIIILQLICKMEYRIKHGNFITKLEHLLQNQDNKGIICWKNDKTMFDIIDTEKMEMEILPKYFRHKKLDSFVRQLNLYGFRKVRGQDFHRFTHNLLLQGRQISIIAAQKIISKKTKRTSINDKNDDSNATIKSKVANKINNVSNSQPENQFYETTNLANSPIQEGCYTHLFTHLNQEQFYPMCPYGLMLYFSPNHLFE